MKTLLKAAVMSSTLAVSALLATVAAAQDTIRFAVTDIDGMESLQTEMGPFKDAFEKISGLKVEFFAVSGRTIAVEAMAADQVDFVLTGPAEYVVFNARLQAQPVVTWNRPDYYSNIVVLDASPVQTVADLKGMKIRVQGNPMFIDMMNAMGGNGIAMDTGEIFSALQTGVIDGAENNPPTLLEHNHFRAAKYYTQTHHLILPEPLLMSKTTWNKLTPEQQALVKKLAKEAQLEERDLWVAKENASNEKLKAEGVEYIEVDTKPFYDATAPVREKYGAQFAELIQRIEAVQ